MIAVIFEASVHPGQREAYLALAASLRAQLEQIDGFISVERFGSLTTPDKVLSLSFWRDEEAVRAWRELESHRQAQSFGKESAFADYRLRVAQVLRDYGKYERAEAPDGSGAP